MEVARASMRTMRTGDRKVRFRAWGKTPVVAQNPQQRPPPPPPGDVWRAAARAPPAAMRVSLERTAAPGKRSSCDVEPTSETPDRKSR